LDFFVVVRIVFVKIAIVNAQSRALMQSPLICINFTVILSAGTWAATINFNYCKMTPLFDELEAKYSFIEFCWQHIIIGRSNCM